jgi:hypothetical protein
MSKAKLGKKLSIQHRNNIKLSMQNHYTNRKKDIIGKIELNKRLMSMVNYENEYNDLIKENEELKEELERIK